MAVKTTELKWGIYRHYKGKLYCVMSVAKNSETLEDYVVYECLYDNELAMQWIRPVTEFLEKFEYIGDKKAGQRL